MNPVSSMGVTGYILFWGLTAIAAGIFAHRGYQLFRYLSLGRTDEKLGHLGRRALTTIGHFLIQQCQLKNITRRDRAGIGHMFMAWGFSLFVIYYVLFIVIAFGFGVSDSMEHNWFYGFYCWVMDIVAPFIVLGALWGIIRRFFTNSPRLKGQRTFESLLILFTVLVHPITHLGKIATQIAAGHPPADLGLATPPLSTTFSNLFTDTASLGAWHSFWFWSHWGFVLFVLAIIGYTRYMHIITAILNDLLRLSPPKGMPSRINLDDPATFGVHRIDGFTKKQLLDIYACVEPGHCQEVCPANLTGKPLNPRLIIQSLKTNLLTNGPQLVKKREPILPLIADDREGSVSEEAIWACTTCGACMEVCPVYIEHVGHIIDMRRNLVQLEARFPEELLTFFENMEQRSNPWGMAPTDRTKWTADIEVKPFEAGKTDYLFYVGCAGAFDARSRRVTLSIAKILDAAGISWGILGKDEKCCGDSLRRLGNEFIFDQQVHENIEMFTEKGVTKVITMCPHCYTTFKNDYRQYGLELDIVHHTELINDLIRQGKININGAGYTGKVVFHDSCYLGRYNQVYDAPRQAVTVATGQPPAEMERNRQHSFCCGAGGGRMWLEESIGKRIFVERTKEALNTNADTICVSCPYCMTMFEDGLKDQSADDKVQVLDVAEIVAKALK